MVIFSLDFSARFIAHAGTWQTFFSFATSWLTIIDLLAIIPYYLDLLLCPEIALGYQRFSVLRLLRLFRLFRHFQYSQTLQLSIDVMYLSLKLSSDALLSMFIFSLFFMTIMSTLLYFSERGMFYPPSNGTFWAVDVQQRLERPPIEISNMKFDSIPAAFWYVLVTMTTVGFGDMVPVSFLGKLISIPLMYIGIMVSCRAASHVFSCLALVCCPSIYYYREKFCQGLRAIKSRSR